MKRGREYFILSYPKRILDNPHQVKCFLAQCGTDCTFPLNIFWGGKLANRVTACQACDDLHLPAEAQEEMKDKGQ